MRFLPPTTHIYCLPVTLYSNNLLWLFTDKQHDFPQTEQQTGENDVRLLGWLLPVVARQWQEGWHKTNPAKLNHSLSRPWSCRTTHSAKVDILHTVCCFSFFLRLTPHLPFIWISGSKIYLPKSNAKPEERLLYWHAFSQRLTGRN